MKRLKTLEGGDWRIRTKSSLVNSPIAKNVYQKSKKFSSLGGENK